MTKKRYLFKQTSFLVSFIQDTSSYFHALVSQNFVNHTLIVPFSLIFFSTCETYLSTSSQVLVFGSRTEDVRKFDCFELFHISCAQRDANIPMSLAQHGMESISRSDHLCVCRVSAMMTTLSFKFTLCTQYISSEHTSTSLSMERMRKITFGSFGANSSFNRITKSSVNCNPFFPGSNILAKCPTVIILAFSRWSHHVHNRSTVRDSVGQQIPHDLIRFCDECCAIGYFVLLFLLQRHALVLVYRSIEKT